MVEDGPSHQVESERANPFAKIIRKSPPAPFQILQLLEHIIVAVIGKLHGMVVAPQYLTFRNPG